jgi:hypothetical protein
VSLEQRPNDAEEGERPRIALCNADCYDSLYTEEGESPHIARMNPHVYDLLDAEEGEKPRMTPMDTNNRSFL